MIGAVRLNEDATQLAQSTWVSAGLVAVLADTLVVRAESSLSRGVAPTSAVACAKVGTQVKEKPKDH
jgi:hypothetical protein